MKSLQFLSRNFLVQSRHIVALGAVLGATLCGLWLIASPTQAANTWDAGGSSQWWFDPVNWSKEVLPPNNDAANAVGDLQINIGTFTGDLGEGVVYDPANDPFFAAAQGMTYPSGGYGPQIFDNMYISRNTTFSNLLTIKGDINFIDGIVIGRSSGVDGVATTGRINQLSGVFSIPNDEFDLAGADTSNAGIGNGTYDYRGGTLDIGATGGPGLRMSHGSNSTNGTTGEATGASGIARFIVHNPNSGGYVRSFDVAVASYAGVAVATDGGTTIRDPDGVTRGVGIFEFHYENGQTRPFQVPHNLSINNGFDAATGGTRSSRLELVLSEAACTGAACVPNDIGLFDVDFGGIFSGSIQGTGDLNGDTLNDQVFSSADASTNYFEGDTVSASFGGIRYDWTISYTGDISWNDADISDVGTILGAGNGTDVVLIGLGSEAVGLAGDFDMDGDVDGHDFLVWQRNPGVGSLTEWQNNYGMPPLTANVGAVPEPGSLLLMSAAALSLIGLRRRSTQG
ncbi:PEP-CTERM sorting domain-containing protein [Bythopirellula polymerisocia]|uniref:Ice-binding protein C-terminal domain-containing protein n=1 Tax=Bythopirellula polymerisocia TaxID=2528003 RepID=A0A5C6D0R2_9BACT|nr:PEP-CTERM sorting domain-containing protein [Bythopirellula polymerisocia]TWU30460.1 hypothetical protein Pla144_12470 [Bythopirellula polymerisocia]